MAMHVYGSRCQGSAVVNGHTHSAQLVLAIFQSLGWIFEVSARLLRRIPMPLLSMESDLMEYYGLPTAVSRSNRIDITSTGYVIYAFVVISDWFVFEMIYTETSALVLHKPLLLPQRPAASGSARRASLDSDPCSLHALKYADEWTMISKP